MLKLLELFLNVGGNLPYLFNKRPGLDTQKLSFIHVNQEGFDSREIDLLYLMSVLKR